MRATVSSREYRLSLISVDGWGKNLVRHCAELGVLAGVYDDNSTIDELSRLQPDIRRYDSIGDLYDAPCDAIVIAAPAHLHAPLALQAISAKKCVFVEKFLAVSVADGNRIAEAAEQAGVQVFVGHALLYHSGVRKLRTLVGQGAVGRVWHVRTRRLSLGKLRHHESVWWSFAPNDVALVLSVFGEEPERVSAAQAGWLTPRIPDTAYADFQFPRGRSAHVEVGWLDPHSTFRIDVFGTEGVLTLEESRDESRLSISACGARPDEHGVLQTWRGEERDIPIPSSDPLREELVAFLTSIRFGISAETDAKQGVAVLRALSMADEASSHPQAALEMLA